VSKEHLIHATTIYYKPFSNGYFYATGTQIMYEKKVKGIDRNKC